MSAPNPFYSDGYWSSDQELSVLPVPQFPFSSNPTPDKYTTVWPRDYQVLPRLYTPRIANRTSWTNLLTYSEQFDNAAWAKNSATIAADAAAAPDGETAMDALLEAAASAEHSVSRALVLTAAPSTVSVFAAGGLGRDWIRVKFADSAATVFSCFFNIAGGYVGTATAGVTASIVALPGLRYRCQITFTPAAGSGTLTVNAASDGQTVSYLGDIAKGVYLWGAQAVTAATSGPYVSTTSTTRTVSAPDQERTINPNAQAQDPLAYLIEEGDPQEITSAAAVVRRTFARVPRQQVRFSTISLTKPNPVAYFQGNVGTILYQDSTLAVAYTLYNSFQGYAWGSNNKFYGIVANTTSANSGGNTRVTWTAHGLVGSETIIAAGASGSTNRFAQFATGTYTVVDPNTIDLLGVNYGANVIQCAEYHRDYTPGVDRIGTRLTSTFYLPGVTVGIATPSDIPVPDPLINDIVFLQAALAYTSGYQTYDAEPLGTWRGPIYLQQLIEINMANL